MRDVFYPAIITNHGGWYYQSSDFLRAVTHSGDKVDSLDLEAGRFDHYSRTWSSWQQLSLVASLPSQQYRSIGFSEAIPIRACLCIAWRTSTRPVW